MPWREIDPVSYLPPTDVLEYSVSDLDIEHGIGRMLIVGPIVRGRNDCWKIETGRDSIGRLRVDSQDKVRVEGNVG